MKSIVTPLRLPNSLKRFLAWIWKYFVSVGSEWEGLEGGGAQRGHGAQKGEGAPLGVRGGVGVGVRSERKMRPRECGGSEKGSMGEELKDGRWGQKSNAVREGGGLQRSSERWGFSGREGNLERGIRVWCCGQGLGEQGRVSLPRPLSWAGGIALWFLKVPFPSVPTSRSPGLARV